jgi:hypothetical protein
MSSTAPSAALMLCVNRITPYAPRNVADAHAALRRTWRLVTWKVAEEAFAIYSQPKFPSPTTTSAVKVAPLDGRVPGKDDSDA